MVERMGNEPQEQFTEGHGRKKIGIFLYLVAFKGELFPKKDKKGATGKLLKVPLVKKQKPLRSPPPKKKKHRNRCRETYKKGHL